MEYYPFFHDAPPSTFEKSRVLRKNMTLAEKELWKRIRKKQLNGLSFRRQHPVAYYILDFYCHELKLALELDGVGHDEKEQKDYDRRRELEIQSMGITIMRFKNDDVLNHLDEVLKKILEFAGYKNSPPQFGEG